jgi:hypothetical protein
MKRYNIKKSLIPSLNLTSNRVHKAKGLQFDSERKAGRGIMKLIKNRGYEITKGDKKWE